MPKIYEKKWCILESISTRKNILESVISCSWSVFSMRLTKYGVWTYRNLKSWFYLNITDLPKSGETQLNSLVIKVATTSRRSTVWSPSGLGIYAMECQQPLMHQIRVIWVRKIIFSNKYSLFPIKNTSSQKISRYYGQIFQLIRKYLVMNKVYLRLISHQV